MMRLVLMQVHYLRFHLTMMVRLRLMEIHMSYCFQMKRSCHLTQRSFHMKMRARRLLQGIRMNR